MKILHVIDSAGIYGAEVMLLNLMREQEMIGLKPILLSIEESTVPESLYAEASKRGLKSEKITFDRGYSFRNALRILHFAAENKISLIHSHGYKGNILLGSIPRLKRKIPLISTLHGWTSTAKFSRIWFYKLLDMYFLKKMDAVVSVNPFLPSLGGSAKMYYIENGLPKLIFNNKAISEDLGVIDFCGDGFVIGAISRLSEEKGLIHLIEAMKIISGRDDSCRLLIIGEGPERKKIESALIERSIADRVMLAGYRDKAFNYLPMMDIYVLPSLTEGLPITILEAMQAGVPIIATKVGAVPTVLGNGIYGRLIKPADPEAIAEAIIDIKANYDSAKMIASKAIDYVHEIYSSRRMAERYLKVYEEVLQNYFRSKGD